MAKNPDQHQSLDEALDRTWLERLLVLSDGVFAIAMTLLVLDLHVPDLVEGYTSADVAHAFWDLWPNLLAFAISFAVIANYWSLHRQIFAERLLSDNNVGPAELRGAVPDLRASLPDLDSCQIR